MVPASQDRFATTKSHTQQIVFRLVENAPQCPLGAPRSVYVCGLCLDSLHTCNTIKPYSYSFSPLPSHFQELFFSFVPLFVCELVLHIFHSMLFLFRWIMRTSFEPQSVLYQFPVSQLPVLQLYTRLPCCTRLTMTHNFNATKGSDKHQRLILLSCCFGIGCGAGFLTWCHRGKHIPLPTPAAHDYDVTFGGGLADRCGRRWYT